MNFRNIFALILTLLLLNSCQKTPEASIGSNKSVAETGEEIYFKNESVNGMRFRWDFGDGTISTEKDPVKAYDKSGSYQIKMIAYAKNGKTEDEAAMNVVINNASDKFIGFYDAEICASEGLLQVSPGPSANEVFVEFDGFKFDASVAGNAIIVARKEMEEDGQKLAYSGSGNIAGNTITIMLKIEFYDEDSKFWFPMFCAISGDKK